MSTPMPVTRYGAFASKSNEKMASLPSLSGITARIRWGVAATRVIRSVPKSPRIRANIFARSVAGRFASVSGLMISSCMFK